MKTKEITTTKATVLVVDFPEESTGLILQNDNIIVAVRYLYPVNIKIPYAANWSYLGELSDVPEDMWKEIVEDPQYSHYVNYSYENPALKWVRTAAESGLSLLTANGVVLENPLGVEMQYLSSASEPGDIAYLSKEWKQAQEQVWLNPHIFIKR